MHVVAAARTLWSRGTEKCPSEFATDGVSTVSEKRPKSGLVLVFLDRSAVEVHNERARVVRLEPDQLVGLIVELAEQNAIELVRAPLVSSHTCKRRLGGFVRRGKERRSEFE